MMSESSLGILFVCLGNICRSPTAQGIAEQRLQQHHWQHRVHVDSCGTAAFNLGKAPDDRAISACKNRGYDIGQQRARQIEPADYQRFDFLLVMDRVNLASVQAWAPKHFSGEIGLLMQYSSRGGNSQLADPFYAEAGKFDGMIASLETAIDGLLEKLASIHAWNDEKTA